MEIKTIDDNNTDFNKVYLDKKFNLPHCKEHGAMNKVSSHGLWRCIRHEGAKDCRVGCMEVKN